MLSGKASLHAPISAIRRATCIFTVTAAQTGPTPLVGRVLTAKGARPAQLDGDGITAPKVIVRSARWWRRMLRCLSTEENTIQRKSGVIRSTLPCERDGDAGQDRNVGHLTSNLPSGTGKYQAPVMSLRNSRIATRRAHADTWSGMENVRVAGGRSLPVPAAEPHQRIAVGDWPRAVPSC